MIIMGALYIALQYIAVYQNHTLLFTFIYNKGDISYVKQF